MMTKLVEETLVLEEVPVEGYKKVFKVTDEQTGLKAIICIHDNTLGPALGGTRIYPYPTFEAALTDVKRLAKGMTHKSSVAETGLGGGKSVIISDQKGKTKEMLKSFAQAIEKLEGLYTAAEDVGCSLEDVTFLSQHTRYVVGVNHKKSSGNPAPFTGWGTYLGIQATLKKIFGIESVKGRTIAIQGLGSVGGWLAEMLFWQGAKLIISDIDWEKTLSMAAKFGAQACPADDILLQKCDILAPCAMGGILNPQIIPQLKCRGIAGCANNQLLSDADGQELMKKGILYAPDFVINAGGLINVAQEIAQEGYNPKLAREKIDNIYNQLISIFEFAETHHVSTHQAAVSLAESHIKIGKGKRVVPPSYHHYT
jgi:leucine dehydrogenase